MAKDGGGGNKGEPMFEESPMRIGVFAMYALALAISLGGMGLPGVLVDVAQEYYDLPNLVFDAVYYCAYLDAAIAVLVWGTVSQAYGIRVTFCSSAGVMLVGYTLQMLYQSRAWGFWCLLAGGMLVDTGRAMIWATTTTVVSLWFKTEDKPYYQGWIFAAAGFFAFIVGGVARFVIQTSSEFGSRTIIFIGVLLGMAVVNLILGLTLMAERPRVPPSLQSSVVADSKPPTGSFPAIIFGRKSWGENHRMVLTVIIVYVLTIVATWSVASLLLRIMNDHDYSQGRITVGLIVYTVASIPTPVITGKLMGKTMLYHAVLILILGCTTASFIGFALTINVNEYVFYVFIALLSFSTGSYTISFTQCASELAFPIPESQVTVLMFFWAQLGAACGTLLSSSTMTREIAMLIYGVIYVGAVIGLAVASFKFRPRYQRHELQEQLEKMPNTNPAKRALPTYLFDGKKKKKKKKKGAEEEEEEEEEEANNNNEESVPLVSIAAR